MARIETLFPTCIFNGRLRGPRTRVADLEVACEMIAASDKAGQRWCRSNGYRGYTSYASLNDLAWRDPAFAELVTALDRAVAGFARMLDYDLGRRRLVCDSLWINILERGGYHTAHIHPHSVISGTYYVRVPPGAGAIRFEDPRLASFMAAPARRANARRENRAFVEIAPTPGTVLLWESYLRHEVPENKARQQRISISFNYALA
jgi:uncharacterized protein (TIGR02466 family)